MNTIYTLPGVRTAGHLKGKTVLLRSELNVPLSGSSVVDDFRLRQALPTIMFLHECGARTVVIGHIGRDTSATLHPVFEYLQKQLSISFIPHILGTDVSQAVSGMKDGDIVLLENLRSDTREETNDDSFAHELSALADVYVNDAFSVSHREHASIVGISRYLPSYVGIQFQRELEGLSPALSPKSPSLCIIGGAKFETKAPLIRKLVLVYDTIFIGGALSNDFFKAQGLITGQSLISDIQLHLQDLLDNKKVVIPIDVLVGNEGVLSVKKPNEVEEDDYIFDAGPETGKLLKKLVGQASFILWNGPLGQYDDGYVEQTEELAKVLIATDAKTIIGGGDTVAAIAALRPEQSISFISTAGGAMLAFLLDGTLPGIEAIKANQKNNARA